MHHCITYIMSLTPLYFFEVEWLNSNIFNELCGFKGVGKRVQIMDGNYNNERKEETTLYQLLNIIQPHLHEEKQSTRFVCDKWIILCFRVAF